MIDFYFAALVGAPFSPPFATLEGFALYIGLMLLIVAAIVMGVWLL